MFSPAKKNNVMSMFKKSENKYSIGAFTNPAARDPTGMRAEFKRAAENATKRADPTGMRAAFAAAAKKGGKRSRKLNTRRRKNRSSKRKN